MSLSLPDKWIWDFWFAHDPQGSVHVFYLQAPRDIGDPDLRHWNVSVGHAVSDDLVRWRLRPDALEPSTLPAWDDMSTWTGSIIRHDERWHLFYTGTSDVEQGLVQRIGMAVSEDLDNWERCAAPVIEADSQWYERLGSAWPDEAWRDPWVFRGEDGLFHLLITARSNTGEVFERGCIGHAQSADLLAWEVTGPITTPGEFGQLEVPQVLEIDGTWFLLFCCDAKHQSPARRRRGVGSGTFYVPGPSALGPFDINGALPLQVDRRASRYAGRIVEHYGPHFISWLRTGENAEFIGGLPDPVPVIPRGQRIELGAIS